MGADKKPDWYDESKVVSAIYAFENGQSAYGGHVVDLGDGTCRFANGPLLGEDGPKWGDRVDLIYMGPFERPHVGARIYADGEEPTGRHFCLKQEPTEEEIEEHERQEEVREQRECEAFERRAKAMSAPLKAAKAEMKYADELIRYSELSVWAREQGLEVPKDLHSEETRAKQKEERDTPEERRQLKLFLLATAQSQYPDIRITQSEVQGEANKMRRQDEQANALIDAFAEED